MHRIFIILFLATILFTACSQNEEQKAQNQSQQINQNQHKATVQEVIQVTDYTYLRVTEDEKEYWIAAPKAEFKVGEVILYEKSMEMKNFTSKELDKTFDSILFIDNASVKLGEGVMNQPVKPVLSREEISVEPASGGITIAQLYNNPTKYSGKVVRIKGKVTKINSGIMKRNWIHIQDGTSSGDNFDLTITSNDKTAVGDEITFEGKISLDKDFGYGYTYKVLMEDAKIFKSL
jgi:hypothetical protein